MIDEYKTIKGQVGEGLYTEKRSKFLAFAHHVTSVEEVKEMNPRIVDQVFDNTCSIKLSIRKSEAEQLRTRLKKLSFE